MSTYSELSFDKQYSNFIEGQIQSGNYASAVQVICAGLDLLERDGNKLRRLRLLLNEGVQSGQSDYSCDSAVRSLGSASMFFSLSQEALSDFNRITRSSPEETSEAVARRFDEAFHMLSDIPLAGAACDDIMPNCLKYKQEKHTIFYIKSESPNIHILRILHNSMDNLSPASD